MVGFRFRYVVAVAPACFFDLLSSTAWLQSRHLISLSLTFVCFGYCYLARCVVGEYPLQLPATSYCDCRYRCYCRFYCCHCDYAALLLRLLWSDCASAPSFSHNDSTTVIALWSVGQSVGRPNSPTVYLPSVVSYETFVGPIFDRWFDARARALSSAVNLTRVRARTCACCCLPAADNIHWPPSVPVPYRRMSCGAWLAGSLTACLPA